MPLLSGTRIVALDAPDDAVLLRPPEPGDRIADVGAAVRDALRFPLTGRPLELLVTRGGRATVVVEPPALPIPGALRDPRLEALAATVDELERVGVPTERQTILVAGGLGRKTPRHQLELLVVPELARRFRGRLEVHDAEDPDLVELPRPGSPGPRVHRSLVETELVLIVTAAETVVHGGPAALLAAADAQTARAAAADSLLETAGSDGWAAAVDLERDLSRRLPLAGVSLVLNHPTFAGAVPRYPYDPAADDAVLRSPLRRGFALLPGAVRARVLHSLRAELTVAAVFAGPPSVAHAEALLRAVEARATPLAAPVDTLCVAVPRTTPHLPRERPNPLLVASLALGLALRLWRDRFPIADDGTLVLVHRFHRAFAHPTQGPYRAFFAGLRTGDPEELVDAERAAAADRRAVSAYREGRACHPLLPFRDWEGCRPALRRLGAVVVADCRDATAARQLGFVPAHRIGAAIDMAAGRAPNDGRLGVLLSPPYYPIRVGRDFTF